MRDECNNQLIVNKMENYDKRVSYYNQGRIQDLWLWGRE
jgi:hypothetical protein